jgi:hypothetical protein
MPTKWTNANYAFRAVLLAPGKHIVRFRYQPKSFRWGAAISLAMLGLLAAGFYSADLPPKMSATANFTSSAVNSSPAPISLNSFEVCDSPRARRLTNTSVEHPDYFFGSSPEEAHIHADNLEIFLSHLKCTAFELPIRDGESFGKLPLEKLCRFLAEDLRAVSSDNFPVVDITGDHRASIKSKTRFRRPQGLGGPGGIPITSLAPSCIRRSAS